MASTRQSARDGGQRARSAATPAAPVTCVTCERGFDAEGLAAKKVARTVKAGGSALSLHCPFCEQVVMVLVSDAEQEALLRCPVPGCAGFVGLVPKKGKAPAFWGCGECGSIWRDVKNLYREITAIVRRFPYRKQSYKKSGAAWVPGRDPTSLTAKIEREPREASREYERC